jgi:hypothetical protein
VGTLLVSIPKRKDRYVVSFWLLAIGYRLFAKRFLDKRLQSGQGFVPLFGDALEV